MATEGRNTINALRVFLSDQSSQINVDSKETSTLWTTIVESIRTRKRFWHDMRSQININSHRSQRYTRISWINIQLSESKEAFLFSHIVGLCMYLFCSRNTTIIKLGDFLLLIWLQPKLSSCWNHMWNHNNNNNDDDDDDNKIIMMMMRMMMMIIVIIMIIIIIVIIIII